MKGIPEISNSSWRLKYDRLRKDAIDSKDNKNKPTSTFDIAPKQTDGKPVQSRQFMGKPIPQGLNRKKFPVKPRKTGVSGNQTGKPLQDLQTGVRTAGKMPFDRNRGGDNNNTRLTHTGVKQKPLESKDITIQRPEDKTSRTATVKNPEKERKEHVEATRKKLRRLREEQSKLDEGRKRQKELEKPAEHTQKPFKPKDLKVDTKRLTSEHQRGRGLGNTKEIPSSSGLINQPDKQERKPKREGGRSFENDPKKRGVGSRNVGDKNIEETRLGKPFKTRGQSGKQLRSQTVADEAGQAPKKQETAEEKEAKTRKEQSTNDKIEAFKKQLRGAKNQKEAESIQDKINNLSPKKEKEIPATVAMQRPTQAGSKYYFQDSSDPKKETVEDVRAEKPNRPSLGTLGGAKRGEKDPRKFGTKIGGRRRDDDLRGESDKYARLTQKLREAKTDEEAKKIRQEMNSMKLSRKERENQQEEQAVAQQGVKESLKNPDRTPRISQRGQEGGMEEYYEESSEQSKRQKETKEDKDDKKEEDNVDRTEQVEEASDEKEDSISEEEKQVLQQRRDDKNEGKDDDTKDKEETESRAGKEGYDVRQEKEEDQEETGHQTGQIIPKKTRTRTGDLTEWRQPPTHYTNSEGKKVKIPENLVHQDKLGNRGDRRYFLAGTDEKTGVTAKEIYDALDGESNIKTVPEWEEKYGRKKPVGAPKPKPTTVRTHSPYTINQLKEWLKDNNQTVDMNDKGAIDSKVKEMQKEKGRVRKSLIDMNTQRLTLLKLTFK
mgnify:FL=1